MSNSRSDVPNNPSAFAHGFDILTYAKDKTDIRNNKQDGGCDVVFTSLLYFSTISRLVATIQEKFTTKASQKNH